MAWLIQKDLLTDLIDRYYSSEGSGSYVGKWFYRIINTLGLIKMNCHAYPRPQIQNIKKYILNQSSSQ